MIATEIVLTAIGGLVAVGAALYKAHERSIPCNSCAFLVKKGGGYWKYTCNRGSLWSFDDHFDSPPKYCKYYKSQEEENERTR